MSEHLIDTSARYDVKFLLDDLSRGCKLCLLHNRPREEVVDVILMDEERGIEFRQSYCVACYIFLQDKAVSHWRNLPTLDVITKDPFIIQVPWYLVKNGDPLKVFFPEDPIDLGLLRQTRRKARESCKP